MDVSDIDSFAIGLVGITKPNIPEEFDLLSLSHTGVFKDCITYAINKPNCVSESGRIRIIYRNGHTKQNIIENRSVFHQLICSVPFVENTELFYKEIFKGKENDTNVQS